MSVHTNFHTNFRAPHHMCTAAAAPDLQNICDLVFFLGTCTETFRFIFLVYFYCDWVSS